MTASAVILLIRTSDMDFRKAGQEPVTNGDQAKMPDSKKRILVADDDTVVVRVLERLLQEGGFDVLTASSGEQAVEIATTNDIDLAILDYRMQGISGLEAARQIRTLTSTRVVIMSLHGDRDLVLKAAYEGALAFITKPPNPVEVMNTVNVQLVRAAELKARDQHAVNQSLARTTERSVSMAVGILVAELKISSDQALARLRQKSRTTRRKLEEICDEMIKMAELNSALASQPGKPVPAKPEADT